MADSDEIDFASRNSSDDVHRTETQQAIVVQNTPDREQRQNDRDRALLIVVLCQQAALAESPVPTIAHMQAREIAVSAILADPSIIDLTQRQPVRKATTIALKFKARAKEPVFQQEVERVRRRERSLVAGFNIEVLMILEL